MQTPALAGMAARASEAVYLGWIAAAALIVIALLVFARERRQRRAYHRLSQRLDELEAALAAQGAAEQPAPATGPAAHQEVTHEEGHPHPTPSRDVLAGMTARLRRLLAGDVSPGRALAEQAILRVHDRLHEGITVDSLAAALHVSPRTLQRGLGHALGCTPRQLILALRMREARRLLLAEDLSVKEVAARLGFSDQHHFTHCFTTFYHVAPSRIRSRDTSHSAAAGHGSSSTQ
jgi:AraC-like DNA-binding protein